MSFNSALPPRRVRPGIPCVQGSRGFTLFELLVVIVVIGILAAVVAPDIFRNVGDAKVSAAQTQIENLGLALDQYRLDNQTYPSTDQGLAALRAMPTVGSAPPRWRGPYLKREIPVDPWGHAYVYVAPGKANPSSYDLFTLGRDGRPGGGAGGRRRYFVGRRGAVSASSRFSYRALHRGGRVEQGVLAANSADEARAKVSARGLFPIEIRSAEPGLDRRPRIPPDDLAVGLRALATLLESGLPIARALAALEDLAPDSWRQVVPSLRDAVREGQTLAAALDSSPTVIPPIALGLIRAGETGSGLARAVGRAADLAEEDAATRRAVRAELAYPILLLASGGVSVMLIVGFVLPRFARILADLGSELPPVTRFVLLAGDVARRGWLPALLLSLAIAGSLKVWTSTPDGARTWHGWLLRLPGVGAVRRSAAASRFAAALAGLLDAGVPIALAIQGAAGAVGDAALAVRVSEARRRVVAGSALSAALEVEKAATPTVIRLVRAGEETGRLGEMLAHGARIEAESARAKLRSAIRLLQPTLVLGFGATVAVVAAALLQAVYRVRPG